MHCVDLGESFPTSIYLQNLASIQPRTSLVKFARSPRTDPPGDTDWDPLRAAKQDSYSNMNTADIMDPKKVRHILTNNPFDIHVIVDVPPVGPRSLGEPLLKTMFILTTN